MTAERLMPEQIAECKKHGRWRLNLSRHPILRAIYEATRAVDELPLATEAATAAVTLVGVLAERAATILDENDAQGERIKELERERDEARQQRDSVTRDYFKQQRRADTNEAERDAAIRRAEDAEKDTARLNWLELQECGIDHEGYGDYRHYSGPSWAKYLGHTLREIADAAIASEQPKANLA